jgi:hypothetical protein
MDIPNSDLPHEPSDYHDSHSPEVSSCVKVLERLQQASKDSLQHVKLLPTRH